jgi:hypothetical protein
VQKAVNGYIVFLVTNATVPWQLMDSRLSCMSQLLLLQSKEAKYEANMAVVGSICMQLALN